MTVKRDSERILPSTGLAIGCFVCSELKPVQIENVGWRGYKCKYGIRSIIDAFVCVPRQTQHEDSPEAKKEAERLKLFDKRLAEAEKIFASGKIDLDSIKDSVIRQMIIDRIQEAQSEAEAKARAEARDKAAKEEKEEIARLRGEIR